MYSDKWEDMLGFGQKDELLALIEVEDINSLMSRIRALEKSESYLETYIEDRKRERENLLKEDDEEKFIEEIMLKVFATKKLDKDSEQELLKSAYIWKKLKSDEDIIDALEDRISELEYNEDDSLSKATCVNALAQLIGFIPDTEQWSEVRELAYDKISKLDFKDFMLFSCSCSNYYIFRNEAFQEMLKEKIPGFSVDEMYYYLHRVADNGDGSTPELEAIKDKKIEEYNTPILFDDYGKYNKTVNGIDKIKGIYRKRASAVVSNIYGYDEKMDLDDDTDKNNSNKDIYAEVYEKKNYKEYIKSFNDFNSVEAVQFLCYANYNNAHFLEKEKPIILKKLDGISREGLLVVSASVLEESSEKNDFIKDYCIKKGLIDSKTNEIIAKDDEKEDCYDVLNAYIDVLNDRTSIRMPFPWLRVEGNSNNEYYDETQFNDELVNKYEEECDEINKSCSFVKNIATLEKCKDVQLVNIINKFNIEENMENVSDDVKRDREYIEKYLKKRILNMKP